MGETKKSAEDRVVEMRRELDEVAHDIDEARRQAVADGEIDDPATHVDPDAPATPLDPPG